MRHRIVLYYQSSTFMIFIGQRLKIVNWVGCYRDNPEGLICTKKRNVDAAIWDIYKYFAIGIVKGELPRRLSFSHKSILILQFFFRAIKNFIRNQDISFLPILVKSICS